MADGVDTSWLQNIRPNNPFSVITPAAWAARNIVGTQQEQLQLRLSQLAALRQRIAATATKPGLTDQDIQNVASDSVSEGILPASVAATELARRNPNDPKGFALQQLANVMSVEQQIRAAYGQTMLGHFGGFSQFASPSPVTGQVNLIGQPIPTTPEPGFPYIDENGVMQHTSVGAVPMGKVGGPPSQVAIPGSGGNMPLPSVVPTTLPLGESEAAQMATTDKANMPNMISRLNSLKQMIPLLRQMGDSSTGPGTQELQYLTQLGVNLHLIPPGSYAANQAQLWQMLSKYFANNVAQFPNGMRLAEGFNTILKGSPSTNLGAAANDKLSTMALAMARIPIVRTALFTKTGLPNTQYANWTAKNFGPDSVDTQNDAFSFDYLKPEDQTALVKEMNALPNVNGRPNPDKVRFWRSLQMLSNSGELSGAAAK